MLGGLKVVTTGGRIEVVLEKAFYSTSYGGAFADLSFTSCSHSVTTDLSFYKIHQGFRCLSPRFAGKRIENIAPISVSSYV